MGNCRAEIWVFYHKISIFSIDIVLSVNCVPVLIVEFVLLLWNAVVAVIETKEDATADTIHAVTTLLSL